MPRYLMKCEPDRDLYVEWSTVVDNLTWVGTRAEALHLEQTDEKRLVRTDATGTSTLWEVAGYPREGAWDDPTIHVANTERSEEHVHSYSLRRADLAAYATALAADDTAIAEALLIPNRHCLVCDSDEDVDASSNLCSKHADVCSNCKGTGWDSTWHEGAPCAEPHACGYCRGGTYSGLPITGGSMLDAAPATGTSESSAVSTP